MTRRRGDLFLPLKLKPSARYVMVIFVTKWFFGDLEKLTAIYGATRGDNFQNKIKWAANTDCFNLGPWE